MLEAVPRKEEERCVELITIQRGHIRADGSGIPTRTDLVRNRGAFSFEALACAYGQPEHAALRKTEQPIESHPAEYARVHVVGGARTRLPDAMVRTAPARSNELAQIAEHLELGAIRIAATAPRLRHGVDDLAIKVELNLPGGSVAGSYRSRAAVPRKRSDLGLRRRLSPEDVVENT
jgi:hypothetical protein